MYHSDLIFRLKVFYYKCIVKSIIHKTLGFENRPLLDVCKHYDLHSHKTDVFSYLKSSDLKNTTQSMQKTRKWDSKVAQISK